MKNARRRPTHRQILAELMKRPRIPEAVRELHGDIEDAVAEAGGTRGEMRHADG